MQKLIGKKLEDVVSILQEKGLNYTIFDNNFSVDGDTKLVTNIIEENNSIVLVTGNFIFNLK